MTPFSRTGPGRRRPTVVVLRSRPLSRGDRETYAATAGEAFSYHPVPALPVRAVRDGVGAARAAAYLVRRRPAAVVTSSSPSFLLRAAVKAYAGATGATALMDEAGPTGAGRAHEAKADLVDAAPPGWTVEPARALEDRPRVVLLGSFAPQEPIQAVMDAARLMPSVDVWITGEPGKCPSWIADGAPSNVTCVGAPSGSDRPRIIAAADIVLTLSADPERIMRPAFEATYAGRPLVVSDLPGLRQVFPHAIHVANDGASIAAAVRSALHRHASLVAAAPAARELQRSRWDARIAALRTRLDGAAWAERPTRTGRFRSHAASTTDEASRLGLQPVR